MSILGASEGILEIPPHPLNTHQISLKNPRTSDGGNVNHSVSLPIILIKIKVDQMIPSSYISSLLVSIL